ncbi:MAG TPA: hypothetical protein VHN17_06540 [Steroidobacteraceae bacterium]|jgi:hypothetical protein|nr:hypothetical protein [Steroidobacteraceae bacterium]
MNPKPRHWMAALGVFSVLGALAGAANAQMSDMKEKEPMYSYVALWAVPRSHWADFEKPVAADQKILDQAIGDGSLIGYGSDINLVHEADGYTHDSFWSSHTMAGVLNVLDAFSKAGGSTTAVLSMSTKHSDMIFVSRHYNWQPGSWKGAYTHGSSYMLKPNAPGDAVSILSKNIFEPVLEKLLAAGSIVEYEIDVEAIHTQSPDTFWVFYLTPAADGVDKVNVAIRAAVKANPLLEPSLDSMVDFTPHRDFLSRTSATYK